MIQLGEVLSALGSAYAEQVRRGWVTLRDDRRFHRGLITFALLVATVANLALVARGAATAEWHGGHTLAVLRATKDPAAGPPAAVSRRDPAPRQARAPATATRSAVPRSTAPAAAPSRAQPNQQPRRTGPLVLAHRGGLERAPENSMAAFDDAIAAGVDYVETDVRHSFDGVAFLAHDRTLRATCTPYAGQAVMALTAAQLAEVRCAGQPIPRLADLVDRLARPDAARVSVMAEVKDVDPVGVRDELARLGWLRVVVQSFNLDALRLIERISPQVRTCPLIWTADQLPAALKVTHDCVGADWRAVDAEFVARAHAAGSMVFPYTVDDPAQMWALADAGVDGLITDHPRLAQSTVTAWAQSSVTRLR
jgi:glycerophosphoryl diester phosphodiesterase